jgi:hypothetical protein
MVNCQKTFPLNGSKHSLQHHPHDAALVNAHCFVSMEAEAMCRPCHRAAHHCHMKRQPSQCHCCHCHGHCHFDCRRHHHCRRQLHCHRCCRCPLPSPLPSAIAVAVPNNHCHRHLCCVAISHRCFRCPRCWPLPSPSPSAITVVISVGHHRRHCRWPFPRVVSLARQELYSNNLSKACLPYFILFGKWAVH